jgi:hypothetical protein
MPAKLLKPVSVQLAPHQMAWLDTKRQHGQNSRSAVLRRVLDDVMAADLSAATAQPEHSTNG